MCVLDQVLAKLKVYWVVPERNDFARKMLPTCDL